MENGPLWHMTIIPKSNHFYKPQDPGSDKKSIKKAYYDAMRDCHPDSNDNDEATEFATFLNEIYEVSLETWHLQGPFKHHAHASFLH